GILFEVQLEERLPTVELDAEQVKRALINLLDNAVAALDGTEYALIRVHTAFDADRRVVRAVVADNGPGLSAEAFERLFEPYFSTKRGGTGLGLAIVKSIVADHKGYVRAASNQPMGTRITIELPLSGGAA
ncbi:MAG TPA: ATP-binding protein, partial [Deferrisomatales bacterium]|nr:ATP-binding protein [Deferrisomatales bacterium]